VILTEQDVRAVVASAYQDSNEFGLLVELAAVTGARPSQLDEIAGRRRPGRVCRPEYRQRTPRLMMPVSRKAAVRRLSPVARSDTGGARQTVGGPEGSIA